MHPNHRSRAAWQAPLIASLLTASMTLAAQPGQPAAAPHVDGWQLAGRLGLAQYIVVPADEARDRDYHDRVIAELCPREATCFLRFYTNTQGAEVGLPLPDAIEHQPTALFQRSQKTQREMFQWSCRLQMPESTCF